MCGWSLEVRGWRGLHYWCDCGLKLKEKAGTIELVIAMLPRANTAIFASVWIVAVVIGGCHLLFVGATDLRAMALGLEMG